MKVIMVYEKSEVTIKIYLESALKEEMLFNIHLYSKYWDH